jgi:hypothetical protein
LQLTNFALSGPTEGVTQVLVESEGDSYVIATLTWPNNTQHTSDIAFSDQDVKVFVKGKVSDFFFLFFFSAFFFPLSFFRFSSSC